MYSLTLILTCRGLHPRTPPWLFLPTGRSSQVTGLAVRAIAWTCYGHGGWSHRPAPVGLVSRSTRDSHPCRGAFKVGCFTHPP